MSGLDYGAQLAADAREKVLAEEARARREGEAERLEPAFPYAGIPFEPEVFGAVPVEWIEPSEK